jgi:hypothetical protein
VAANPLVVYADNASPDAVPLAELKQHLMLYVDSPPGPKTARKVMDLYAHTWGNPFTSYRSTSFGSLMLRWEPAQFFTRELPKLRQFNDWGYAFSDDRGPDSWMMMFHGYRPATERGRASFFRFEFDRNVDTQCLARFAGDLLDILTCVSGNAGFFFQGQPRGALGRRSFDQIYAWARRYWGPEVSDLDVTVSHALSGYKTVNWLTLIGPSLRLREPDAITRAQASAYAFSVRNGGILLQASEAPELGDVNRWQRLPGYEQIAQALEPLQVQDHGSFGPSSGSRWTRDTTNAWLRRFTDPHEWRQA